MGTILVMSRSGANGSCLTMTKLRRLMIIFWSPCGDIKVFPSVRTCSFIPYDYYQYSLSSALISYLAVIRLSLLFNNQCLSNGLVAYCLNEKLSASFEAKTNLNHFTCIFLHVCCRAYRISISPFLPIYSYTFIDSTTGAPSSLQS